MRGEPPSLLVSGLASNYFRMRALLPTPDFGLSDRPYCTVTHRLWGCVGEVVGSPRADRCVLRVSDGRGTIAFGVRPR